MTAVTEAPIPGAGLAPEDLVAIYGQMVRARRVSERMVNLQRQGRVPTFSQIDGQEAAVVASMWALDRDHDWIVPAYREPRALKSFPAGRILPVAVALGTQIPQAVGLAWAQRLRGEPGVVLVYFGDGATSEGDFYEGGNLAGVVGAPVVLLCINNAWAISTPRSAQTAAETLAAKAVAFGIPGVQVDGNDVEAVYAATATARARAAAGEGPTLIEAVTYRLGGHTTADDPGRYVPPEELAHWRAREPLVRTRALLEERGLYDPAVEEEGEEAAAADIDEVLARAATTAAAPESLFDHVYAEPTPRMLRQRQEMRSGGAPGADVAR